MGAVYHGLHHQRGADGTDGQGGGAGVRQQRLGGVPRRALIRETIPAQASGQNSR